MLQDVRKSEHFNASTQGEGKNGPVDGLGTNSGPSPTRIDDIVNGLFVGHAARVLADFSDNCIDCVITSPPYHQAGNAYGSYLDDLQTVWNQCERVFRPNGKLAINAPLMPVPQAVIRQDTRHVRDIAGDIKQRIMSETSLRMFSVFIWRKQTSETMRGAYPFPGNNVENNTVEFIHVYVKPGKPPKFPREIKEASRLSLTEHRDLTQQIWNMRPENTARKGEHLAPFPLKLPARLIKLYTFGEVDDFPGEIILDPFCGSGTTCAAAKMLGRRFIGIDIEPRYAALAQERVSRAIVGAKLPFPVGAGKWLTEKELESLPEVKISAPGEKGEAKHKRKTFGRANAAEEAAHDRRRAPLR